MALGNRRTDRSAWILRFIILDSLGIVNKNSMSLGLVVLEEKLFTRTLQTDALMSDDIKIPLNLLKM